MIEEPLQKSYTPRHRDQFWVGRTRRKLAEMLDDKLSEAGYTVIVDPSWLSSPQGRWRYEDVYRLEGLIEVIVGENLRTWSVSSWDKMSDLVRGFNLVRDSGWSFELNATNPRKRNGKT